VVHFIDVGQADCILAQLPNGEILLIDGGNKTDGTEVCKYLRDLGIRRIDYLVATHPHEDHIGGLPLVIRSFEIGEIYAPKATATTNIFEDFLKSIQEKGMTIHSAQAGQTILASHDLSLDILAPKSASYKDLNDYSVVIKLTFKKNTFLFMGDAETISEGEIKADVNVDVLKVGHHGSDSSSSLAFLQKATPSISVISCGAGNSYGHPKDITLKHLSEVGSEIYRTDLQGTILITSDGSQISVNQKPSTAVSLQPTTVNVTTTKPSTVPSTTVPSSKPSTTVPSSKPSTTVPSTQPSTAPTPVTQPNTVPPTVAQTKPVVPSNITVFVTETGTKYHKEGCRYLSDSKIPMELEQAKLTYTPCKVCKPPE
jgi:competence protein ComEC